MEKIGKLLKTLIFTVAITSAMPSMAADFWQIGVNLPATTTVTSTHTGYGHGVSHGSKRFYNRNAGILQHHGAHMGYRVGRPVVKYGDMLTHHGYSSVEYLPAIGSSYHVIDTTRPYTIHGGGTITQSTTPGFSLIIGGH